MPKARKTSSPKRIPITKVEADFKEMLAREFEDEVVLRSTPNPGNRQAIQRLTAALRRRASTPGNRIAVEGPSHTDLSEETDEQTLFHHLTWSQAVRTPASKITPDLALPARRAAGLYDFYPARVRPKHAFAEPFLYPFIYTYEEPPKSSIAICSHQLDSGVFSSTVYALSKPVERVASAWCGTLIPIDPKLHDVAHGIKDVVVWAQGTIQYDYTLQADLAAKWGSANAAVASVSIRARLVRYNSQTNKRIFGAEDLLGHFATQTRLYATLVPNGQTSNPPSSPFPTVGGPYAWWSTGHLPFYLGPGNGQPRMLNTDSVYYVAVVCAAHLEAKTAGPGPEDAAKANASAQMFLRLVTLGIRPHDPTTVL